MKHAKILESSGLSREQAEAHIQVLSEVLGEDMLTKQEFRLYMSDFETRFEEKMGRKLDYKLKAELQNFEYRMIVKLGGLMAAFLATGLTLTKLFLV